MLQFEGGGSWTGNCRGGGVWRKGSGGSVISPFAAAAAAAAATPLQEGASEESLRSLPKGTSQPGTKSNKE